MSDVFSLPIKNNIQVFYYQTGNLQYWVKPRGCKFVHIFCLSGGGGGGGGPSAATGTNRIGGGGGGTASFSTLFVPSDFIGENLTINVGAGGTGGAPNGNGNFGLNSYVTGVGGFLYPGRGNVGTAAGGGGAGGSNPTLWPYKNIGLCEPSIYTQIGGTGVLAASGNSITVLGPWSSGAAGGGASSADTSFAGGSIIGSGFYPTILGGQNAGDNGGDGYSFFNFGGIINSQIPFLVTGGSGGAGNATGTGGNGGNGGFGCGGGGGGAGVTGGRGGNGGNGLVIITWF